MSELSNSLSSGMSPDTLAILQKAVEELGSKTKLQQSAVDTLMAENIRLKAAKSRVFYCGVIVTLSLALALGGVMISLYRANKVIDARDTSIKAISAKNSALQAKLESLINRMELLEAELIKNSQGAQPSSEKVDASKEVGSYSTGNEFIYYSTFSSNNSASKAVAQPNQPKFVRMSDSEKAAYYGTHLGRTYFDRQSIPSRSASSFSRPARSR